jgi:hypothetical protein
LKVISIVTLAELQLFLADKPQYRTALDSIADYRTQYGV